MELSQDQVELQDLIRAFFAERVTSELIRRRIEGATGVQDGLVEALGELGLREGFCGPDAPYSTAELAILATESGASLLPEPTWERLLCEGVFPRLLDEGEAKAYLARIGTGPVGVAPRECSWLKADAKGKSITGEVAWCFGGRGAASVAAVATLGGSERVAIFDVAGAGVAERTLPSLDLTASLTGYTLKKAPAYVCSEAASELFLDLFEILKASEAYGVTRKVLEIACEYVKTREQFGVPVGGFQAVQQKLADAYAASESLGALARFAAWSVECSPDQRRLTARAAVSHASDTAPLVCEVAMQCLGGMGFTWEHDLHLYLRRAKALQIAFPNSESRARELIQRASPKLG